MNTQSSALDPVAAHRSHTNSAGHAAAADHGLLQKYVHTHTKTDAGTHSGGSCVGHARAETFPKARAQCNLAHHVQSNNVMHSEH